MKKISTVLDGIEHGSTVGAWIPHGVRSEVAIYADRDQGVVLGIFKDLKRSEHGCDVAVSFNGDKAAVQVIGEDGKLKIVEVNEKKLSIAFENFFAEIAKLAE